MTDREKLVYLIKENAKAIVSSTENGVCVCLDVEALADHLLDHGVTVNEPQKPLTVEEIKPEIVCWYEKRNDTPSPVEISRIKSSIELYFIGRYCYMEEKKCEYGKTWRCWAEKPTEEERKNAKWEE